MAVRDGYCKPEDLLINGTRLPQSVTVEGIIASAADEIDSELGLLYKTPVLVNELDADKRDDYLLLKSINANLASGRLLTSMAAGGENNATHNYGKYLINFAYRLLNQITNGVRVLTSAERKSTAPTDSRKGPKVVHGDRYSLVDNFYQNYDPLGSQPEHWNAPAVQDDASWPGYS
jgi:hypothetical protein